MRIAFATLIGVALSLSAVSLYWPRWLIYGALAAILAAFWWFSGLSGKSRRPALAMISVVLLATWHTAYVRDQELDRQLPEALAGLDVQLTGQVTGIPDRVGHRQRFELLVDPGSSRWPSSSPNQHLALDSVRVKRLRLSWYGPSPSLQSGDRWRLLVRLKPPRGLGNPGSFDYARWLFQRRIHATGYVRDSADNERLMAQPYHRDAIRHRLATRLADLPAATDQVGLVQALSLGIGAAVPDAARHTLQRSGTAHLLAISGLHIGLVAAWGLLAGRFLWRCLPIWRVITQPDFAMLMAVGLAAVYASLAGFALPAQRALIMLLVVALALRMRRATAPGAALSVALVLVLLADPLSFLSAGFWLSFGTVALLAYLHVGRDVERGKLHQAFVVHCQLGVVLLPLTGWFFQSASIIAPLANLVAVPVVGIAVVPLCLLLLVCVLVWPAAANVLLWLTQSILSTLLRGLEQLMSITVGSVPVTVPDASLLLLTMVGCVLFFAPAGLRVRRYSVLLLLPLVLINTRGRSVAELELHVLDVGQGLAAVVLTPTHTLVYDTGGRLGRELSMAEAVIEPFLSSLGRHRIDRLVVSHGDSDHAAGVDYLKSRYPELRLVSNGDPPGAEPCVAGDRWAWGDVQFAFVHPARHDRGDDNDRSCVLLVHLGRSRVLLTGDIEQSAEHRLAARVGYLPITVMTAPHHGSRTSSTAALLAAVPGQHVVYAAGHRNAFGFPHDSVQMRYKLSGAEPHETGRDGAIGFRFDRQGLLAEPSSYWQSHRRFWHENREHDEG